MKQGVQKQLQEKVDAKKFNVQIHASQLHTDPFTFIEIKPLLMSATVLLLFFFTFTRGNIFVTVLFEFSPM